MVEAVVVRCDGGGRGFILKLEGSQIGQPRGSPLQARETKRQQKAMRRVRQGAGVVEVKKGRPNQWVIMEEK